MSKSIGPKWGGHLALVSMLAVNEEEASSSSLDSRISEGTYSDLAALLTAFDKVEALTAALFRTGGEAKADLEKVKGLNGVDDYVKYANLRIAELNKSQELITRANSLDYQILSVIKPLGDKVFDVDIGVLDNSHAAYRDEMNKRVDEISKLDKKALKLKADKKL